MAIAVRASAGNTVSGNSITVTKPTGTVNNDVMWAVVAFPAGQATIGTVTDPAGWTRDDWDDSTTGFPGHHAILLHKVASSEGADYTWSWTGTYKVSAVIIAIDGVDTTSPTEGWSANSGVAATAHVISSAAPTESDSLLLGVAVGNNPGAGISGAYTAPSGMTERIDQPADDGGFGDAPYIGLFTKQLAAAGSTGNFTATSTESTRFVAYGVTVTSDNPSSDASVFIPDVVRATAAISDFSGVVSGSLTADPVSISAGVQLPSLTSSGDPIDPIDGFLVEIAFGCEPFGTIVWTDVTDDVMTISTSRGRSSELQRYPAGTATVTLLNIDRQYDPLNADGPYYGELLPAVPVRIRTEDSVRARRPVFYGYVRLRGGWTPNYPSQFVSTATVQCVDLFGLLAAKELAEVVIPDGQTFDDVAVGAGLHTGLLAGIMLFFQDVPEPLLAKMDNGRTITQGSTLGKNLLDFIQICAETEGGNVYVGADGVINFDDRYSPFLDDDKANPVVTFSSAAVPFRDDGSLTVDYASVIYNKARINREGGDPQEFSDAFSIAAYTESTYELRDLFMKLDPDAHARAEWYVAVYAGTIASPQALNLAPRRAAAIQDAALLLELRNRVLVTFDPPGGGDPISQECFVEKISHTVSYQSRSWTTALEFSSALAYEFTTPDDWLVLDDPAKGLLDDSRRLAF